MADELKASLKVCGNIMCRFNEATMPPSPLSFEYYDYKCGYSNNRKTIRRYRYWSTERKPKCIYFCETCHNAIDMVRPWSKNPKLGGSHEHRQG